MSAVIRSLASSGKALYFFSTDGEKVYHVNSVPKEQVSKAFDGKIWLQSVSAIVGGKVRSFFSGPKSFAEHNAGWRSTHWCHWCGK